MIIFELIQWVAIGFIGLTLYQCYKTLKALLQVQKSMGKQVEIEIKKIYEILNELDEKIKK